MIKKIYDINGVAHEVQAAGTVYNEELNSLALGKNTSAIGRDQLVFGRNNIPDANKVEIVGSSDSVPGTLTTVTGLNGFSELEAMVDNVATDKHAYDFDSESGDYKNVKDTLLNNAYFTTIRKVHNTIKSKDGHTYLYIGDMTDRNGNPYSMLFYKGQDGNYYTDGFFNVEYSTQGQRNIRTLDWDGNETLDGGLSLGGPLKIGNTTLTEAQLTALLALIPSNS